MESENIFNQMKKCRLCPRNCGVDRESGQVGYCKQTHQIRLARAALHMWEEPCISGMAGSGAVFFCGCTLGCVYCQNHEIAAGQSGKVVSLERLVEIFLELQKKGALNINLVTGTMFIPQIAQAIRLAKEKGLSIPVIYNTSAYEKVESLRLLEGLVDVYLPDLKYLDASLAKKYSFAEDYPQVAKNAIREMVRQQGRVIFDQPAIESAGEAQADEEDDYANMPPVKKGVIVRHLLLPGQEEASREVIRYLYESYGDQIYISIMNQYTPMKGVGEKYPELGKRVPMEAYESLVDYAIDLGLEQGFIQGEDVASESFIPPFDGSGL